MNALVYGLSSMQVTQAQYEELATGDDNMLFESCSRQELEATYLYDKPIEREAMFEAITTTAKRVERTMNAFNRELNRQLSGTEITSSGAEVSEPRVSGGFATMTARFPLSDGQSIAIIFHSPSGKATSIVADDVLIAFRFLLNKRDVTATVSPAGGQDISLKQVTLKLSNLAERNSEKFQKTQSANNAKKDKLAALQTEAETKETELGQVIADADKEEQSLASVENELGTYQGVVKKAEDRVVALRKKLEALSKVKEDKPVKATNEPVRAAIGDLAPAREASNLINLLKAWADAKDRGDANAQDEAEAAVLYARKTWVDKNYNERQWINLINQIRRGVEVVFTPENTVKRFKETGIDPNAIPRELIPVSQSGLSPSDEAELGVMKQFLAQSMEKYEGILSGDPAWAGYEAKAVPLSISSRVERLDKQGRVALMDAFIELVVLASENASKPLFTRSHSIWNRADRVKVPEDTSKPESPAKPKQEKATNETLTFVHYAKRSGSLQDAPAGAVDSLPKAQVIFNNEMVALLASVELVNYVGVLTYTQKLTDSDITKYDLVELDVNKKVATSTLVGAIDFKVEVSNRVGRNFGKTWDQLGYIAPTELLSIIADDPRFDAVTRKLLITRAQTYAVENKINVDIAVNGKTDLFWYGLRARPFSFGGAPNMRPRVTLTHEEAAAKFPDLANDNNALRHGAIAYAYKLSDKDVYDYELVDLSERQARIDGKSLSEDDYDMVLGELVYAAMDAYGESATKISRATFDSLSQSLLLAKDPFAKFAKNTDLFRDRKDNVERYQALVTFRKTAKVEDFLEELRLYVVEDGADTTAQANDELIDISELSKEDKDRLQTLNDAGYVIPNTKGEITVTSTIPMEAYDFDLTKTFTVSDLEEYADVIDDIYAEYTKSGRYTKSRLQLEPLIGVERKGYVDINGDKVSIKFGIELGKNYKASKDKPFEHYFIEVMLNGSKMNRTAKVFASGENDEFMFDGGILDPTPAKGFESLIYEIEDSFVLTLDDGEGSDVQEGGDNVSDEQGKSDVIVKALENALNNETDTEALLDLLEKSIDELEALNAYDENEALIERVSDRVTELLTLEGE
jgi:hypothetical protein